MSDIPEPLPQESNGSSRRRPPYHYPNLFWPLLLILVGVVLLLQTTGLLAWNFWTILWRLWPLLLIALGISILFGRRSPWGTIVSVIVVLIAVGIVVAIAFLGNTVPWLADWGWSSDWQTARIDHPLEGIEEAQVLIEWSGQPGRLSAARDSANLIEGEVSYRGNLVLDVNVRGSRADVRLETQEDWSWLDSGDWGEHSWDVRLSPDVALDLNLDTGSGSCDFDLTGLQIDGLTVDAGSGSIDLNLPAGRSFEARISGESGRIDIKVPENVGVQVRLDSGSGGFRVSERFRLVEGERDEDGVWETSDYRTAEYSIILRIDQESGSIDIR